MPNLVGTSQYSQSMPALHDINPAAWLLDDAMAELRDTDRVTSRQLKDSLSAVRAYFIGQRRLTPSGCFGMVGGLTRGYEVLQTQKSHKLLQKKKVLEETVRGAIGVLQRDLRDAQVRFDAINHEYYDRAAGLRQLNDVMASHEVVISRFDEAAWLKLRQLPAHALNVAMQAWSQQNAKVFSRDEALRRFPAIPPGEWRDVRTSEEPGVPPTWRSVFVNNTSDYAALWMELGKVLAERVHLTDARERYARQRQALRRDLGAVCDRRFNSAHHECTALRDDLIRLADVEARLRPDKSRRIDPFTFDEREPVFVRETRDLRREGRDGRVHQAANASR